MISRPEKIVLLLITSLFASLNLYSVFVGMVAPDSNARKALPQLVLLVMTSLGFAYLIGNGVIRKRPLAWGVFIALIILNFIVGTH